MPNNAQSLAITDAYRARLRALVTVADRQARAGWSTLDWNNGLRESYEPVKSTLVAQIERSQEAAVRLSAGYATAYLRSELFDPAASPLHVESAPYVGVSVHGLPLDEAYEKPIIKTLEAIGEGQPNAGGTGLRILLNDLDVDIKHAARQSLQDIYVRDPHFVGWRRATAGTCEICLGLAETSLAPVGTPLEIHPNCECVSEGRIHRVPVRSVSERSFYSRDAEVINGYTDGDYLDVNEALRFGSVSEMQSLFIKRLDGCVTGQMLPSNMTLFRGYKVSVDAAYDMAQMYSKGSVMQERAFLSTSVNEYEAEMFATEDVAEDEIGVELIINVEDGAVGLDIEELAMTNSEIMDIGEGEVLLPRNAELVVNYAELDEDARMLQIGCTYKARTYD